MERIKKPIQIPPEIKTFKNDNRYSIQCLYEKFDNFREMFIIEKIAETPIKIGLSVDYLPVIRARTEVHKNRPAMVGIYSTHGKEPEGANAVANKTKMLTEFSKDFDLALYLLPNPSAYCKNRYHLENVGNSFGRLSATDCSYIVYKTQIGNKVFYDRNRHPSNSAIVESFIELLTHGYNFVLAVDHHGCETSHFNGLPYNFHNGTNEKIAQNVRKIMIKHGSPLRVDGYTEDGHKIRSGAIHNYHDGSIDDWLAQSQYRHPLTGLRTRKHAIDTITIETRINQTPLKQRVRVHEAIITAYPTLLSLRVSKR